MVHGPARHSIVRWSSDFGLPTDPSRLCRSTGDAVAGRSRRWMHIRSPHGSVAARSGRTMTRGRAKRSGGWIPAVAALFAMAVFAAAVPIHHTHMLAAALLQTEIADEHVSPQHHHAHKHGGNSPGHHDAGSAGGDERLAGTEHDGGHDMPRCPVCSLAQAGKAPIAPAQPFVVALVRKYHTERPRAETLAVPTSLHFRPVQPRAPPTAG